MCRRKMSALSHLPKTLFLKTTTSKPTEKLTICYILFLLLSEHLMCCQSFGYTLGKAEGYGWELLHVIVQLVYPSVFCVNTIKSRYWGHTLSSYISISHFRAGNPTLHSLSSPYTLFSLQRKKQPTNQPKKKPTQNQKTLNHQDTRTFCSTGFARTTWILKAGYLKILYFRNTASRRPVCYLFSLSFHK